MESEALLEIFFLYLDRDLSLQKGAVHLQSSIQLCICSHRYHRQQEHGSWASICFLVPE
ncbi:hypothetical protein LEMLEM_LOCUS4785 [Lemmus lemmus]